MIRHEVQANLDLTFALFEERSRLNREYMDYLDRHWMKQLWSRECKRLKRELDAADLAHKTAIRLHMEAWKIFEAWSA